MNALLDTYAQFPLDIVAGSGSRLRDRRGREYWDFYGGHAVALLGHSHPEFVRAVTRQAQTLTFYSNVLPLDVRARAAQMLCDFAPAGLEHVFFCNSGAEANENALKLALQQTGRSRLAGFTGGWHGRTLLCLSVTDDPKITKPFAGLLPACVRLRPNEPADLGLIDATVAAVIVEPIQSIAGVIEMHVNYLKALRRRCDEIGALLIYDEVQCGMGRFGRPFASGLGGVLPDMLTLAKGVANGIPMGAVLMTPAVAGRTKPGDLGSTFGGGPVACAALIAVIDAIHREDLLAHAAELGDRMYASLRVGPVRDIVGRGCLIGLCVSGDARQVQKELLERGFVTGTCAKADRLRLMPPINLPFGAVDELAAALAELGEPVHATLAEHA